MKKIVISLLFWTSLISSLFGQNVFINEVNYIPSNEQFFEISGPVGTDLSGWEVILYDAIPEPYDTISLNGEIPGMPGCNGIVVVDGAVLYTTPGSGMALVNDSGQLVQYITYGDENTGTTSTSGIINGVTSENIGTQLIDNQSLQLSGIGTTYSDFTWGLPGLATPDVINTNQVFTGTGCITTLPVELAEFKANLVENKIVLSWTTLSETNHSHFEILHSSIGTDMRMEGRVYDALSDVDGNKKYEFIFNNITSKSNYFQLRQVDLDGQSELSNIVFLAYDRVDTAVKIFPNPAHDFIDIRFNEIDESTIFEITILDGQGRVAYRSDSSLINSNRIDVSNLENGIYILQLQTKTMQKRFKFVKQKY